MFLTNRLLHDLDAIFKQHSKSITNFDLPKPSGDIHDLGNIPSIIADELSIPVSTDDLTAVNNLNEGQLKAYNLISQYIRTKKDAMFFIDGPGGTGKIFLYRAILATFRHEGNIILATASSGIAATLLPGGTTAHSKLKIPIDLEKWLYCGFSKQSDMRLLIERCSAIIWDEAPMTHRKAFEAVDRSFRDVTGNDKPFGGKIMIFGGDFRQVMPVVINASKVEIIRASIVESFLWANVKLLKLTENMRARGDAYFSDFLLRIGDGRETTVADDMIRIPNNMSIPWEDENSINNLIDFVFPNIAQHNINSDDVCYIETRALITPLNEDVNKLNGCCLNQFPGVETVYYSFDSVSDDHSNLYLPEFLNSIDPGNLPPHKLILKEGAPIMLLRNIDPKIGLCNGTRLICKKFGRNVIEADILGGRFKGLGVFIPRMPLKSAEDARMPFELTRKQFPVRLSFALTINKAQGQTIGTVGIYLPNNVFSHGQLYVALSRGVSADSTKILVKNSTVEGYDGFYTKNVVYKEIFDLITNRMTDS